MSELEQVSEARCFDGRHIVYKHRSAACDCTMRFAVFLPPAAERGRVPALYWLSGPHLHRGELQREGGRAALRRRARARSRSSPTRARVASTFRARTRRSTSEPAPGSMSTRRRPRGRRTTRCTITSKTSSSRSSMRTSRWTPRASRSAVTRWAGMARSSSDSATRTAIARSPHSHRSPPRASRRGDNPRSPRISAPTRAAGSTTMSSEVIRKRPSRHELLVDQGARGSVPRTASACRPQAGLPRFRPTTNLPRAARLRSRVLLREHVHRRAPAVSFRGAALNARRTRNDEPTDATARRPAAARRKLALRRHRERRAAQPERDGVGYEQCIGRAVGADGAARRSSPRRVSRFSTRTTARARRRSSSTKDAPPPYSIGNVSAGKFASRAQSCDRPQPRVTRTSPAERSAVSSTLGAASRAVRSRTSQISTPRRSAPRASLASLSDGATATRPVPRPEFWGGYRLWIDSLELWAEGANRFHERLRYRRELDRVDAFAFRAGAWTVQRLQP